MWHSHAEMSLNGEIADIHLMSASVSLTFVDVISLAFEEIRETAWDGLLSARRCALLSLKMEKVDWVLVEACVDDTNDVASFTRIIEMQFIVLTTIYISACKQLSSTVM